MTDRKANELETFGKWKETQSVKHFQDLYASMKNLIYDAAKKASFGSNIPESAHRAYAAQNFHDALRTFNPNSGAALQTHVYNAVHQKAKRLNYLYQNLGHIPEPRAMQIGLFQTEVENLTHSLGRPPSAAEIADHLHWSLRDVTNLQKEIHKDLSLAEGVEESVTFTSDADEEILQYIYYELTPEEQLVYDYIFGKHGKPRYVKANQKVDFERISKTLGFSTSKTRTIFVKIRDKLKKALKR